LNQPVSATPASSTARRLQAWGVHLFTASGAVCGAAALVFIGRGELASAGLLMLLSLLIDSFDGTLARLVGVEEVLPDINGRRLDDIVDYLNFVIVPVVFMVEAGSVPGWPWVVPAVLASAYGFSRENAKTEDDFFLGWPSYWNVVALYLWLLDLSQTAGVLWILGCAAAVFVPLKYIYPSKLRVLRTTTIVLGLAWGLVITFAILWPGSPATPWLIRLSLAYLVYYVALSLYLGGLKRPPS